MPDTDIEQAMTALTVGRIADDYERDSAEGAFDRALYAAYDEGERRGMEKAAAWHDEQALQFAKLAADTVSDPLKSRRNYHHMQQHEEHAAAIRSAK